MLAQDIILLLQTTATHIIQQHSEASFADLRCHCAHPGQSLHCEDCPYLEAQLSRSKPPRTRF